MFVTKGGYSSDQEIQILFEEAVLPIWNITESTGMKN